MYPSNTFFRYIPNISQMDTAWRLHLTNRTIQHLDILEGDPPVIAVWYRRDRVAFYQLETGVSLDEMSIVAPETTDYGSLQWQNFVAGLQAPNQCGLPLVRLTSNAIYSTKDKSFRLYRNDTDKFTYQKGAETRALSLPEDFNLNVMGFDADSGAFVLMDETGNTHLYRNGTLVRSESLRLLFREEFNPLLSVSKGGSVIYATDGKTLIKKETTGDSKDRHFSGNHFIRQMESSPDGTYVITSDLDTSVLRIYDGETLQQTHQSFALDLMAESVQLQLIADLPPVSAAVSALSMSDSGVVAFAIYGVVCVTHIDQMNAVPA